MGRTKKNADASTSKDNEATNSKAEKRKAKVVQVYFSSVSPLQEKLYEKIQSGEPVQVNQTSFVAKSNLLLELALIGMVAVEKLYGAEQFELNENKTKTEGDKAGEAASANRKGASTKSNDALSSFGVHTS